MPAEALSQEQPWTSTARPGMLVVQTLASVTHVVACVRSLASLSWRMPFQLLNPPMTAGTSRAVEASCDMQDSTSS